MHSRFDSHPSSKFSPASRRSTSLSSLDDSSMRGRRIPGTNAGGEKERRGEEEKEKEEKGETRAGSGRRSGQLASETRSIEAVFGRENRSKMEETAENSGHSSPNNGDARVCFGNSPCCGGRGMHVSIMRHAFSFLSFSFLSIDSRSARRASARNILCRGSFLRPPARNRPPRTFAIVPRKTLLLLDNLGDIDNFPPRISSHFSYQVRVSYFVTRANKFLLFPQRSVVFAILRVCCATSAVYFLPSSLRDRRLKLLKWFARHWNRQVQGFKDDDRSESEEDPSERRN